VRTHLPNSRSCWEGHEGRFLCNPLLYPAISICHTWIPRTHFWTRWTNRHQERDLYLSHLYYSDPNQNVEWL
jgi:hypothetical protein